MHLQKIWSEILCIFKQFEDLSNGILFQNVVNSFRTEERGSTRYELAVVSLGYLARHMNRGLLGLEVLLALHTVSPRTQ